MEMKKIRYSGVYPIFLQCPGFNGYVNKSDEVSVLPVAFDELNGHDDWELVTEKKVKQGGE